MKRDKDVQQERIAQARKIRESIERRVSEAEVRYKRLEAERELIARRIERQEGGSAG